MSTRSSDKVREVFVVQHSNVPTRVSARRSGVVLDENQDDVVDSFRVIRLTTEEVFLPHLLPIGLVSLAEDPVPEVKAEKPEVNKPSVKRARSSNTKCPVPSVLELISNTNCLSIICLFVEWAGVDVQLAETEEKIKGYLRVKLENVRREWFLI